MTTPLLLLATVVTYGCIAVTPAESPTPPAGEARIDLERGDTYTVRALFDGAATDSLTYRLNVVRTGTAGRSQSAQSGAFEAAAGRTDTLSTVRISAVQGDRVEIRLLVQRGEETLSEAVVEETVR